MDKIKYINLKGLYWNPSFSQIVTLNGKGKTIYIGGQDSLNSQGEVIGKGDIAIQTK